MRPKYRGLSRWMLPTDTYSHVCPISSVNRWDKLSSYYHCCHIVAAAGTNVLDEGNVLPGSLPKPPPTVHVNEHASFQLSGAANNDGPKLIFLLAASTRVRSSVISEKRNIICRRAQTDLQPSLQCSLQENPRQQQQQQ